MKPPDYLSSPTCWSLFFGGILMTGLCTPVIMRVARAFGAIDRGGYRKLDTSGTPLWGGLAILAPLLGLCILGVTGGTSMLDSIVPRFTRQFIVLAVGAMIVCAVGVVDDMRGMRARTKLALQTLVACFVCFTGHHVQAVAVPFLGTIELGTTTGFVLSVLWIVGLINAFNLIDGLDGLASGVALIATCAIGILALQGNNTFLVLVAAVLAGSLLAFLGFNFHPARVFLGDTGSMLLGYVLASITLMGTYKSNAAAVVVAPILALGFPIFETLVSMLRRAARGLPVFAGDNRHTHHRLLRAGFSQRRAVLQLYAVTVIMAGASIILGMVPQKPQWAWLPFALYVAPLVWIGWVAGYLRPNSINEAFQRRERNAVLGAFARYAVLSLNNGSSRVSLTEILGLCRRELDLRLLEVWFEEGPRCIASSGQASRPRHGKALETIEKMRVQTLEAEGLVLQYEYNGSPSEHERQETSHCLAAIFDQIDIPAPRARVLDMEAERTDNPAEQTEEQKRQSAKGAL